MHIGAARWTINITEAMIGDSDGDDRWIDLVTVAAHEIGHSLGLSHSQNADALMFDTYFGPHRFLHAVDVADVRRLYESDLGGNCICLCSIH